MTKQPIVNLINFTQQPIELMLYVFKNMTGIVPESFEKFSEELSLRWTPRLKREFMDYLAYESLAGGIKEFVSTSWYLGNVSRALQQQLTRHRMAGYCIQSMRIQSKENFASDELFHMPSDVKDSHQYGMVMKNIETMYGNLLANGEPNQVARGVLPLNIYSPITMVVNLRSLRELICTRLCEMAQGEFKHVAFLMMDEVAKKMGSEFNVLFKKPCERLGFCPHAEGCGDVEPRKTGVVKKDIMTELLKEFIKN